ncbi:hypothetical protein [Natrialba sp. PRR66]|uniref:hypothetical protein n=1 Tax=Natrialba sp. PRR66 TaxID=3098146 RepID=UPI002B1DF50A|nr:hypothetical protein [Natrialba sp. PRR66]
MEWNITPDNGVDSQTDHEFVERPCPADLGRGFVVREPQRASSYHQSVVDAERRSPCSFSRNGFGRSKRWDSDD